MAMELWMATCEAVPSIDAAKLWGLRADLAVSILATKGALNRRAADAFTAATTRGGRSAGRGGAGERVMEIHSAAELARFIPSARAAAKAADGAAAAAGKAGGAGGEGKSA